MQVQPQSNRHFHRALGLILLLGLVGLAGCTREFFRNAVDKDVEQVLTEKNKYAEWAIEKFYVYPDPRARFADSTNPDRPPMPPDDPAARDTAPNPQKPGKAGTCEIKGEGYLHLLAGWDTENRAEAKARGQMQDATESTPVPPGPKPLDQGPNTPHRYRIKLEQAAELGLINSREFQDRRENLYLAALPVTLERFSFGAQFFFTEQAIRNSAGAQTPGGRQNNWIFNTGVGFSKLFSTGALLLFNVANQTVFNLGGLGSKETISTSTLTLDLIQPLLRGGGRAVTLEPLTLAERSLLYEIRTYARFRKEFFASIAGNQGGSITGSAFVPTGVLQNSSSSFGAGLGASGLIPGIIPQVNTAGNPGLAVTPGQSGRLNLSTAIPPSVSGYLGTLLQYVQIGLDRSNIANLEKFLKIFRAIKEGGDILQVQVDQVDRQLLQGYNQLYMDQQQYFDSLDRFRLQLGLPTDLPMELDDTPIRPLLTQFARFQQVLDQFAAANKAANLLGTAELAPKLRSELRKLTLSGAITQGTRFNEEFPRRWQEREKVPTDVLRAQLRKDIAQRDKLLNLHTELELEGKVLSMTDQKRLDQLNRDIDLSDFELVLRQYEGQPWKKEPNPERQRAQQTSLFHTVVVSYMLVVTEARNERIEKLRRSWPALPAVCVDGRNLLTVDLDQAYDVVNRTTLANRLDLMNVRAQLVDSWRQLAVFANSLLGVLNVEYRLNSSTPPGAAKPLAFSGSRTQSQLILNAQLPLVRIVERNNYRASLIAFQRQRRALMEAEDLAKQAVQGEIRQLRQFGEQYKLYQRQVELAYLTVDSSLEIFQQPPAPGITTDTATRGASLANQLLQAQGALPLAQNNLLTSWITYLNTRFQLYRDLELMPLDYRGVWIDDNAACDDSSPASRGTVSGGGACPKPEVRSQPGNSPGRLPERIGPPAPQTRLEPAK